MMLCARIRIRVSGTTIQLYFNVRFGGGCMKRQFVLMLCTWIFCFIVLWAYTTEKIKFINAIYLILITSIVMLLEHIYAKYILKEKREESPRWYKLLMIPLMIACIPFYYFETESLGGNYYFIFFLIGIGLEVLYAGYKLIKSRSNLMILEE